MKNSFTILINGLDTAEKTISELEEMLTETSETKMQREKKE